MADARPSSHHANARLRSWLLFALVLAGLWVVLAEGARGLFFAAPVLALALYLRHVLPMPFVLSHLRPWALLAFLPYFLAQSIIGGVDVAWRALRPGLPIAPDLFSYPCRLKSEGARVFMAQVASLLPGTLACRVGQQTLLMHVINGTREAFIRDMQDLERRTARLFGEELEATHDA